MQSVLIIRLSSLGDVVLATALVRQIALSMPEASIDVAVDARFADVWKNNPRVRNIHAIDRALRTNEQLLEGAHKAPYDLIIDLQRNRRSKTLIGSIAPASTTRIVTVQKHRFEKLLLVWMKIKPKHVVPIMRRYWQTVESLQVAWDEFGPELWSENGRNAPNQPGHYIGIAPGARHATKRWPAEAFAQLIGRLVRDRQQQVVLLGGPDDVELCDRITELTEVQLIRADGAQDIATTISALDGCAVVVSNDSAVMHMARARQIPVVGIFGSTVRELGFAPAGDHVRIVERDDVTCRPCSHIGRDRCPKGHFDCLRLISASDVLAAIDDVMRPAP